MPMRSKRFTSKHAWATVTHETLSDVQRPSPLKQAACDVDDEIGTVFAAGWAALCGLRGGRANGLEVNPRDAFRRAAAERRAACRD